MDVGVDAETATQKDASPWMQELENRFRVLLHSGDGLLERHPNLRRRVGHSLAYSPLHQVLEQLHRLERILHREDRQWLLPWVAALEERLQLLGQRRIPPSRSLHRFRGQCRKLHRWLGQLRQSEDIFLPKPDIPWGASDVLVGSLRRPSQLDICLTHGFYHVPASQIPSDRLPIRYVAIYQSRSLFGDGCGIRFYGQVKRCIPVHRREISEIPKDSDEPYYRLEVVRWEQLEEPITVREVPFTHLFTNFFLLMNSRETPELYLKSELEYRHYQLLKATVQRGSGVAFRTAGATVRLKKGQLLVYRGLRTVVAYSVEEYCRTPAAVFGSILEYMKKQSRKEEL